MLGSWNPTACKHLKYSTYKITVIGLLRSQFPHIYQMLWKEKLVQQSGKHDPVLSQLHFQINVFNVVQFIKF